MINPLLHNKHLSWTARLTTPGTLASPQVTSVSSVPNAAGPGWRFTKTGQLVLLGYKVRFTANAAGDGVAFVDRRPALTPVVLLDSPLFSVLASAAGRFDSGANDIFVPLGAGRVEGSGATIFLAGQLELEVVAGATALEVLAWGIYCQEPTYKPTRGAVVVE